MPRTQITIGNDIPVPSNESQIISTVFLVQQGTSTGFYELNFLDGSITYFDKTIKQTFEYLLIDNIGLGSVRVAFNRLGLSLTQPTNGAKTLRPGDSLYIQDYVRNLSIYFIDTSIVELVLMGK
jgi:hypothetical protein